MYYSTGGLLLIIGFGLQIVAGLFFRKPGTSFWTASMKVWKPGEYLKPTGAALLILGFLVVVTGIFLGLFGVI